MIDVYSFLLDWLAANLHNQVLFDDLSDSGGVDLRVAISTKLVRWRGNKCVSYFCCGDLDVTLALKKGYVQQLGDMFAGEFFLIDFAQKGVDFVRMALGNDKYGIVSALVDDPIAVRLKYTISKYPKEIAILRSDAEIKIYPEPEKTILTVNNERKVR